MLPMVKLFDSILILALVVCLHARRGHADSRPGRAVFALIVTTNHGASGAQPDLHYADDDGIKYFELFRTLAPDTNVVLHTELDRDSERLYPWARSVVHPPTKSAVVASIEDLRR